VDDKRITGLQARKQLFRQGLFLFPLGPPADLLARRIFASAGQQFNIL
jgi:hypothetical protein